MTDAKSTRRHTIAVLGLLALSAGLSKCALAGAVKTVKPVSFADVRVESLTVHKLRSVWDRQEIR